MPIPLVPRASRRRPIVGRCLVVLTVLGWVSPSWAEAPPSGPLTEADVVHRALGRAAFVELGDAEVAAAEGAAAIARALPNPELAYVHERTLGDSGTTEQALTIAQRFDLARRRALAGEAGDARVEASRRDRDALRVDVAAEARRRFWDVVHRQARIRAVEGWLGRLDEALSIVARREARGDAATYDRRRLEREQASIRGRLEAERAALDGARARLEALAGPDVRTASVAGSLAPAREEQGDAPDDAGPGERPRSRALALAAEAATLEARAAARWWLPELRLEGGWRGVEGLDGTSHGFVVGAAVELPLWDQASGARRQAQAEARRAMSRRTILDAELDAELAGARAEAKRLEGASAELRTTSTSASADLVRIAVAGYGGGELGLLELVDAYRGAADDELSILDLELAARRARIDVDRLLGATP